MKRAIRRHHRERLKAKRKRYWGYPQKYYDGRLLMSAQQLSVVTRTPHPCSCRGCGNQRQFEGRTLQELRCYAADPPKQHHEV